MKKYTNYILILTVIVLLGFLLLSSKIEIKNLKADSGFDSSWDSGSSSSDYGGFDFGGFDFGGFDYDYDYGSYDHDYTFGETYYYYHDKDPQTVDIILCIFLIILAIIVINIIENFKINKENNKLLPENIQAINRSQREIPLFNAESFKEQVVKDFIAVQEAWMDFDYNKLRTLLTDELFNTYKTQLKTLELKHQKNKMHDFKKIDCVISSYSSDEEKYTIDVGLKIKFYDYLVDKNGNLIRGDRLRRNIMTYNLTYVKSKLQKFNKCPNCNSPLDNNGSNHCPYCNSVIVSESHDWLLSKKRATNQVKE